MRLSLTLLVSSVVAATTAAHALPAQQRADSTPSAPASAVAPAAKPFYVAELTSVERPPAAVQRFGPASPTRLSKMGALHGEKYQVFQDSLAQFVMSAYGRSVWFRIVNRTPQTISVVWDRAAWVGLDGATRRVTHSGISYQDMARSQPPSVIVRGGSLTDEAIPIDNVHVDMYGVGGRPALKVDDLLPRKLERYAGKTVQLLLPLEVDGTVHEYLFVFTIDDDNRYPPSGILDERR